MSSESQIVKLKFMAHKTKGVIIQSPKTGCWLYFSVYDLTSSGWDLFFDTNGYREIIYHSPHFNKAYLIQSNILHANIEVIRLLYVNHSSKECLDIFDNNDEKEVLNSWI